MNFTATFVEPCKTVFGFPISLFCLGVFIAFVGHDWPCQFYPSWWLRFIQRQVNVMTFIQRRINIGATLMRRCINVMLPLGRLCGCLSNVIGSDKDFIINKS